jgi:hypothetical protein
LEFKESLDQKQQSCKEKGVEQKFKYKPYKAINNWSVEEDREDDYCSTPQQINNNINKRTERKHNRNITYRKRKIMKKKEKRLYNGENSDDNNTNTHSDFLIGKAVAMAISFGMIKSVKTMDVTSNLVNHSQCLAISKCFSFYEFSELYQKLISFWII